MPKKKSLNSTENFVALLNRLAKERKAWEEFAVFFSSYAKKDNEERVEAEHILRTIKQLERRIRKKAMTSTGPLDAQRKSTLLKPKKVVSQLPRFRFGTS